MLTGDAQAVANAVAADAISQCSPRCCSAIQFQNPMPELTTYMPVRAAAG